MQKNIYSSLVIFFAAISLYFYSVIFSASVRYEANKTLFIHKYIKHEKSTNLDLKLPVTSVSWVYLNFLQNPAEVELYLRAALLDVQGQQSASLEEMKGLYRMLLNTRPTWPYLYSGLLQINQLQGQIVQKNLERAIAYGVHELKVIKSLAEILFHGWNDYNQATRDMMLNYLSEQAESRITTVVDISAKFSRIYEYCDFLYEKKHVEYPACKSQYWQPLSDE